MSIKNKERGERKLKRAKKKRGDSEKIRKQYPTSRSAL
jgi:hypothetical protein